jgi:hypothetical protein
MKMMPAMISNHFNAEMIAPMIDRAITTATTMSRIFSALVMPSRYPPPGSGVTVSGVNAAAATSPLSHRSVSA